MHGTADKAVPVSESRRVYNAMKAANKNTPRLRYDEFAGVGHSLFARVMYTGEAYEWLFKHSTTDPSRKVDRTIQIPQSRLTNQPYRGLNFRGTYLKVVNNVESFPAVMTPNPIQKQSQKSGQKAQYHTIVAGDTLYGLARKYKTTVKQLCEWNNITETAILQINKKLRVK
jgi:LysM repeat protein